jgi:Flp pilus assembly protein TadB
MRRFGHQIAGDCIMKIKGLIGSTLLSLSLIGVAGSAMAETNWQKNHPRRTEVNNRLANQRQRINNQLAKGDLSKSQARALHRDDHQVRQEERDMASQNGGHITKSEQHTLNQQENAISHDIPK